ncbi:MAG: phospho-N-acetylmuramoyl-pentapeptide-transferase [Candidatus Doudnabacteria bacterium]|nr:phospho-N-acetylmuramoyl-pentapeptide-transferase [Candidatus Doudnabacteria bacterium]
MTELALAKIFILAVLAFFCSLAATPILTNFLYKNNIGKSIRKGKDTPIFSKMHAHKEGVPTMGGILVSGSTLFIAGFFWAADRVLKIEQLHFLNFLTRRETLLPLGAFLGASLVGLIDDWLDAKKAGKKGAGLRFRYKIWLYLLVAAIGAYWFYFKLEFSAVHVPFLGSWELSYWFLPFFILAVTGISFAVNLTDGLDGLAGGTLLIAFFCYAVIAYTQGRVNLAAMTAVICGSLLAFLWFNVFPARFFMGDTGSMGLGVLLAILAFLTNSLFILFFIGFIFFIEACSTLLQFIWRRAYKKKLLLSSPLHHHFEALGWPESKVTMRFWIISAVMGIFGMVIYFIS